jgi:hypothetical protein
LFLCSSVAVSIRPIGIISLHYQPVTGNVFVAGPIHRSVAIDYTRGNSIPLAFLTIWARRITRSLVLVRLDFQGYLKATTLHSAFAFPVCSERYSSLRFLILDP